MLAAANIIAMLLGLYGLCVIAWLIVTTLISFNVVNRTQPFVMRLNYYLNRLVGPPLRHIRRHLPSTGQLDLSPIVLLLLLTFAQDLVLTLAYGQNPALAVAKLIANVIQLLIWLLIIDIVMSLLISFNIVNRYQPIVSAVVYAVQALVDPLLAPIRRFLPPVSGIDLSPMVLIFALGFLKRAVFSLLVPGL